MSEPLEERLRQRKAFGVVGNRWHMLPAPDPDCIEAADALDTQAAEIAKLKAEVAEMRSFIDFVNLWVTRDNVTDAERRGVIRFHPTARALSAERALAEARAGKEG